MKRRFLDEETERIFNEIIGVDNIRDRDYPLAPVGGYTSYYRSMVAPCTISAEKCDEQNMKMLGLSMYNPIYLIGKIKRYFLRR
jgi:hypothetical protein